MLGQGLLSWKAALLSCSRVPCGCAWKSQGRSLSFAPVRTVNRNRSPRLKASGRQNNVGKGSRQNRSVTSGKGLALRVGPVGPLREAGLGTDAGLGESLGLGRRRVRTGASDPSVELTGCEGRVHSRLLLGWHPAANSELARTRGIRLSN